MIRFRLHNLIIALLLPLGFSAVTYGQDHVYKTKNGHVDFTSDAPLEVIKASSEKVVGLLDTDKKNFVFSLRINTFEGFNSPLQREHFNENYLESDDFPKAIFKGKIIEDLMLNEPGNYTIRAKGKLTIHGVSQTKIIKVTVVSSPTKITATAKFPIALAEYDIKIPSIVTKKLAKEVEVSVKLELAQ